MACSIKTLLDLEDMSIEELSGCLAESDGRDKSEVDAHVYLLLIEEEWRARSSAHGSGEGLVTSCGKPRESRQRKEVSRPSGDGGGHKSDGGGKPSRRNGK
ncbi:hypothetical protein GUJ93_ZPchr0013g37886 [Zizania palustris]|uniref:Uncharacterized protein n=1 Tax=Zizania palustris TaxID=103762 RepID=A0A8J6BUK6_ZIZPA|nr:hypothetical protein GUJ93_ZPchr0013g37886 [Zizania palustris]